jgi:drug/metabolite transporter (DMT)-like permease
MRPTRIRALVVVGAVATLLSLLLQRALRSSGRDMPPVPWTAAIGLVLVACLVYSAALPVRRMIRGGPRARPVDPLRAARAAVLGWYLAQVLLRVPDLDVSARQAQAVRAAITALAALAACVAGLLAERMCRVPPDDTDLTGGAATGRSTQNGQGRDIGETGVTGEARRHE